MRCFIWLYPVYIIKYFDLKFWPKSKTWKNIRFRPCSQLGPFRFYSDLKKRFESKWKKKNISKLIFWKLREHIIRNEVFLERIMDSISEKNIRTGKFHFSTFILRLSLDSRLSFLAILSFLRSFLIFLES